MKKFKTTFTYSTKMILSFDQTYETCKMSVSLGDAVAFAEISMKIHNFSVCDIIDANTGEVLAIVKKEEDND